MSGVTNVCAISMAPQAQVSSSLGSSPKDGVPLTRIQLINKLYSEGKFEEIGRVVGSTKRANPTEPVHRTHQARVPGAEVSIRHLQRLINTVSSIMFRVIGSLASLFYYCITSPWHLSRLIQTQLIGAPSKDPLAGKVATVAE